MNFSYYILDPNLTDNYIKDLVKYSLLSRKNGILALENIHRSDLIGLGLDLMIDGHEPHWLNNLLENIADNAIRQMALIFKSTTLAFESLHKTGENNAYKILINCFQPYAQADELEQQARDLLRLMKNSSELKKQQPTQIPAILIKYIESLYELKELHQPEQEFCRTINVLQHSLLESLKQSYNLIAQGIIAIQEGENPQVLEQKLNSLQLLSLPKSPIPKQKSPKKISEQSITTKSSITEIEISYNPGVLALDIISVWLNTITNDSISPKMDEQYHSMTLLEGINKAILNLPKPVVHILVIESLDISQEHSCLIVESTLSHEWQLFSIHRNNKEHVLQLTPHGTIDNIARYGLSHVAWVSSKDDILALIDTKKSWPEIKQNALPITSNLFFLKNWNTFYEKMLSNNYRRSLLCFNDLIYLDNRGLQALLRHIEQDTLILALANASSKLIKIIIGNMSQRSQQRLDEDLSNLTHVSEKESLQAQKKIINLANQFLERGDIQFELPKQNPNQLFDPSDPWQQALEEMEGKDEL